jgi:hypothetical protein
MNGRHKAIVRSGKLYPCICDPSGIAAAGIVGTLIMVEHTAPTAALRAIAIGHIVRNTIPVIGTAAAPCALIACRPLAAPALLFSRSSLLHNRKFLFL